MSYKQLESHIKAKYGLILGELTLEKLQRKVAKVAKTKIKISGRSYKTGKKKTKSICLKDLLD